MREFTNKEGPRSLHSRKFACREVTDRVIMAVVIVTRPAVLPFRFAWGAILWDQQSGILFSVGAFRVYVFIIPPPCCFVVHVPVLSNPVQQRLQLR